MLIRPTVVTILQYTQILNHHVVHLRLMHYTSILSQLQESLNLDRKMQTILFFMTQVGIFFPL